MPRYEYITDDGESVEHVCRWADRPNSITLKDGRIATFDFAATARHIRTQSPALDGQEVDRIANAVHPNQVEEYNKTAAAVGLDTRWNERGDCITPNRTERKKLENAKATAQARGDDPEFQPSKDTKGIKV